MVFFFEVAGAESAAASFFSVDFSVVVAVVFDFAAAVAEGLGDGLLSRKLDGASTNGAALSSTNGAELGLGLALSVSSCARSVVTTLKAAMANNVTIDFIFESLVRI